MCSDNGYGYSDFAWSHELCEVTMSRLPDNAPLTGSMVTFLLRDKDGERFRVGEVIGPVEVDPQTSETWIGVRIWHATPERTLNLIPLTAVLNVSPPENENTDRDAA